MEHIKKWWFMLEIRKIEHDRGIDYKIISNEQELNIMFNGDGDLYFSINRIDRLDEPKIVNFEITEEDNDLYNLFDILYNRVITCDIYKLNEFDLEFRKSEELEEKQIMYDEWNQELREYPPYNIIQNGIISWRHDEQLFEEANILNIYKEENKYRLEFISNDEDPQYIEIRFRNSGSRYQPFNRVFMDLYNSLQMLDIKQKIYAKSNKK